MIEGLPANTIQTLRAQENPPRVPAGKRRIALYAGGMAVAGIEAALQGVDSVATYRFYRLRPDHWAAADVLILPQLNDVAELTPAAIRSLRDWVRGGGTLLLTHDSTGFRWHPRLFPEVATGVRLSSAKSLRVEPNSLGLAARPVARSYNDHVVLQPAPGATVLVGAEPAPVGNADTDSTMPSSVTEEAVVVTGRVGKGRVILCGQLLGYKPDEAPFGPVEDEARLLRELIALP
jgi:hypothetical protein